MDFKGGRVFFSWQCGIFTGGCSAVAGLDPLE